MQRAKDGRKEKNGNWILTGAAGLAPTAIGYFRIYRFGAPDECHLQGEVTLTGQGGVMTVDNLVIGAGQKANVTRFVLVDGNA